MNEKTNTAQEIGIVQSFLALPAPLRRQVISRLLGAAIALIGTIIMLLTTGEIGSCVGFLLVLFFAYLGLDILWEFRKGNIIVARMIISKARKGRKGQYHVLLREASATDLANGEFQTVQYTISPGFRDKTFITTGTVLNIYISQNNPQNILAYEILGEQ